jgi:hypothetical protein
MHHLIASYLFQNKACPLPGIGVLLVTAGKAESDFLNKTLKAPVPFISFIPKEQDASNLLDYIAAKNNATVLNAIELLGQFCNTLKGEIIAANTTTLKGVGNFFTDSSGKINFRPNALPELLLQPVHAERVIHPQAEHTILVGDKETTNTVMTEYFTDEPVKKSRWWIWAIILGIVGIVAVVLYLVNNHSFGMAGNSMPL